jgi:endonuclease III
MNLSDKYTFCISVFREKNPNPKTELNYKSNFELIIAVILSAQCTDKRVNLITPALFKAFPNPQKLANAEVSEIYNFIKSCSYPNNKAIHLKGMAQSLIANFNSNLPNNFDDLISLPGVGRKTANVLLSVLFNKATMAVDTHVFRVSNRIGLSPNAKTPFDVEKILVSNTPEKDMHDMHHWLILHGRYICNAKKPKCSECYLTQICDYFLDNKSNDRSSLKI